MLPGNSARRRDDKTKQVKVPSDDETATSATTNQRKSLDQSFRYILDNRVMCDVTFTFKQDGDQIETISAHKLVLSARSPVFEAMFNGHFVADSTSVNITDTEVGSFREMLRYIYCEEVELTITNVAEITYLAKKYMLGGLTKMCIVTFKQNMEIENVCQILDQGIHIQEEEVIKSSLRFMHNYFPAVIKRLEFGELSQQALELLLKEEKQIDECQMVEAVLKWAKKQLEINKTRTLRDVLGNSVYHIRYTKMSVEQFATYVGKSDILTYEEKRLFYCYFATRDEKTRTRLTDLGFQVQPPGIGRSEHWPTQAYVRCTTTEQTDSSSEHWQLGKRLKECFSYIFEKQLMCDVTFTFKQDGGETQAISAHKLVLSARSPFFETMFKGHMLEQSTSVNITNIEIGLFREMLRYIYGEKMIAAKLSEIVYLAKTYMLDGLVEAFLTQTLTLKNVCSIVNQGLQLQEGQAIRPCIQFMQSNLSRVIRQPEFGELSQQALEMLLKEERQIDECQMLEAVLKWGEKQLEINKTRTLRDVLGNSVYHIRYTKMSVKQFATYVGESAILTDKEKCLFFYYFAKEDEKTRKRLTQLGFNIPSEQTRLPNQIVCQALPVGKWRFAFPCE